MSWEISDSVSRRWNYTGDHCSNQAEFTKITPRAIKHATLEFGA
jgi:hypothetical protein